MSLTITADGRRRGLVTVTLDGELDLASSPQLRGVLHATMHAGRVVLDLTRLDFCDAAGLRALLEVEQELTRRGARMELANPCPMMMRVLAITGLDRYFTIAPAEAVAVGTPGPSTHDPAA